MKIVLPCRGEFGLKVCFHVPAVHAIEGPKAVCIEPGEEALYPSADAYCPVDRADDNRRRGTYPKGDIGYVSGLAIRFERDFPGATIVNTNLKMPRERFIPEPHEKQGVTCDIVVCPRKRDYGAGKNWEHWFDLTDKLSAEGFRVFAGGAPDSSYDVTCDRAWDYERNLDATIEAMHSAKLVVATDAGLANLAVLCGRPLLMITHASGLIAPGPVTDENGRVMEDAYWPVKMERYNEANHTGSSIKLIHHAWYSADVVFGEVLDELC